MASIPEYILGTKKLLSLVLFLGLGVVLVGVYTYSKSGTFFSLTPKASSVCSSGGGGYDCLTNDSKACGGTSCYCKGIDPKHPLVGVCVPKPTSTPKPTTKATPTPRPQAGCGSANKGSCSSGTCKSGYTCAKSGSSCGCVSLIKKR